MEKFYYQLVCIHKTPTIVIRSYVILVIIFFSFWLGRSGYTVRVSCDLWGQKRCQESFWMMKVKSVLAHTITIIFSHNIIVM